MRPTIIRLLYPAICKDKCCGAYLPVGTLVRYYGRNGIYGVYCHTKTQSIQAKNGEHLAMVVNN
jgi:hypothetical protein